jgi:hypothetical protein
VREQHAGVRRAVEHRLGHPVVHERRERVAVGARQRRAIARRRVPVDAALEALHRVEAAVGGDVGRLRRPRRDRAGPRHDDERGLAIGRPLVARAVGQQAIEQRALGRGQRPREVDVVAVARRERDDRRRGPRGAKAVEKLGEAERRGGRAAGQREKVGHREAGCAKAGFYTAAPCRRVERRYSSLPTFFTTSAIFAASAST